jgi:serine phosphatase RsbU (regulator of sigma subunit)
MTQSPSQRDSTIRIAVTGVALVVGFLVLYEIGRANYLLFHALVESFSIVVAAGIFIIAWNTRDLSSNRYLLVLGLTHVYVAIVALLHAFAYKGMGVFPQGGANLPTQLWIISRGLEAAAFLAASISLRREVPLRRVLIAFGVMTGLALASIWVVPVFPTMFVEGVGLTATKVIAEYIIMALFAVSGFLLWRDRDAFEPRVSRMLLTAIVLTIAADMAFTLYTDVYGLLNLLGHYFVLLSFVLIYRALINTTLREPYSLLFRELKRKEETEHTVAETLQKAMLSGPDRIGGIEIEHAHVSATEGVRVGGDFWDLFSPAPGRVAFALGDICGKGISAVAYNVIVRVTLRTFAYENADPASVLARTNEAVIQQFPDDKFATVVYGLIDVESGEITVMSAGHPVPVLCSGGSATPVDLPINPPLGVVVGHTYVGGTCSLEPGGALVLFSDGLIEAGQRADMYGMDRVLRYLVPSDGDCGDGVAQALLDKALAHAHGTIDDDVAVMVLRRSAS